MAFPIERVRRSPMTLGLALLLSPSGKAILDRYGEENELFVVTRDSQRERWTISMVRSLNEGIEEASWGKEEGPPSWVWQDWGVDLNACAFRPLELVLADLTEQDEGPRGAGNQERSS